MTLSANTIYVEDRQQPAPSLVDSATYRDARAQLAAEPDALLWDLDNVTTRQRNLHELADALTRFVGPQAPRVAAARRVTYRACRAVLEERGLEVLSGGCRASGADRRLLERARRIRQDGIQHFVVVSNDGDLARLARLGRVHVITLDPQYLSTRLAAVANAVSRMVLENGRWCVRAVR